MEKPKTSGISRMETLGLFFIGSVYIMCLFPVLLTETRMFAHDTVWYYGLMRYFYNSILGGTFPYWDPYSYSGQPFYYNVGIARVFEIPSLFVAGLNVFMKASLFSMYHWDFVLRIFLSSLGVYFCFREVNRYLMSNLVVFAAFLFSSFGISAMRQCGLMTSFMWTPWALMFLLRSLRRIDLYNTVGLALFTGWSITSYQAGYTLTFLQIFAMALVLTKPAGVMGIFKDRRKLLLLSAGFVITAALSLQVLSVFIEKDRSVPVLRRDGDPESSSYTEVAGGKAALPEDLKGLLFPARIASRATAKAQKEHISEGHLYIGLIPLLLSLAGMRFSSGRLKKVFLIVLVLTLFLMFGGHIKMGPAGKLVFPFLIFSRHMQLFQPFFLLVMMYFTGQGMDVLIDRVKEKTKRSS